MRDLRLHYDVMKIGRFSVRMHATHADNLVARAVVM